MKKQIKFTAAKNQCSVLVFALWAGVVVFGLCQASPAQITRRTNQPKVRPTPQVKRTPTPQIKRTPPTERKVIVIKGTNVQQRQPELESKKPPPPTKTLTQAEKEILFKKVLSTNGMVLEQPVKIMPFAFLTTRNPYVENKASLVIKKAESVDSHRAGFRIKFDYFERGGFEVLIKPTKKGQWFLVDCDVSSTHTINFSITKPDGGINDENFMGFFNPNYSPRLQTIFQAKTLDIQRIIFANIPHNAEYPEIWWDFHSCEVTLKD